MKLVVVIMVALSVIGVVIKAKKLNDSREKILVNLSAREEWRMRNGGID